MVPAVLRPHRQVKLAGGSKVQEHAMSHKLNSAIAVIGIDIGKYSFHTVGLDDRRSDPCLPDGVRRRGLCLRRP